MDVASIISCKTYGGKNPERRILPGTKAYIYPTSQRNIHHDINPHNRSLASPLDSEKGGGNIKEGAGGWGVMRCLPRRHLNPNRKSLARKSNLPHLEKRKSGARPISTTRKRILRARALQLTRGHQLIGHTPVHPDYTFRRAL